MWCHLSVLKMQQSNLSQNDKPINIFLTKKVQNWVNRQGNADCAVFPTAKCRVLIRLVWNVK